MCLLQEMRYRKPDYYLFAFYAANGHRIKRHCEYLSEESLKNTDRLSSRWTLLFIVETIMCMHGCFQSYNAKQIDLILVTVLFLHHSIILW